MFAFSADPAAPKPVLYRELCEAARALTMGESDAVANMANIAALIWQYVPDLNWAGFYRVVDGGLVLGPFIGKPAPPLPALTPRTPPVYKTWPRCWPPSCAAQLEGSDAPAGQPLTDQIQLIERLIADRHRP